MSAVPFIEVDSINANGDARIHVGNNFYATEDRCLVDLRITDPRHDKRRIEETKGGLIQDCYCWVLTNDDFRQWKDDVQSPLLWIKGDPGKGKTMLLCGIIDALSPSTMLKDPNANSLLSYSFCQGTDARINNAVSVLRGIIYLIVYQKRQLASHVRRQYEIAGKELFEGVNAWVALCDIFNSIVQDPDLPPTYLVIDALDECGEHQMELLDLIVTSSNASDRVKWIVSSRNWAIIEERLQHASRKTLSLELNASSVSAAVTHYVHEKVGRLASMKSYSEETRKATYKYLLENADGTFLWVALVCRNLENVRAAKTLKILYTFPPGLEPLYQRMMVQIRTMEDADDREICMQLLSVATIVYRPLMLEELASLVDLPGEDSLENIIELCGSLLAIRECALYFVHQSVKEFLTRCVFPQGMGRTHLILFQRSVSLLNKTLRRDIYDLEHPGTLIDDVVDPTPDPLAPVRYSCIYWLDHLIEAVISDLDSGASHELQDNGPLHEFIRRKYLYWLEALSLLGSMLEGITSMIKLNEITVGDLTSTSS
ncbi:Vegetative incompatibility protein HET-E-1 [Cladobotryum mycophilum]|uniref:Vegetative incompatibility protein HET-E-1 n=1 Tax=Cladobotryum mycophilum TaxID=491253 RepID=A0ABR0SAP7_9HYPO